VGLAASIWIGWTCAFGVDRDAMMLGTKCGVATVHAEMEMISYHSTLKDTLDSTPTALKAARLSTAGVENSIWVSISFDVIRPQKPRILIPEPVPISHTHLPMVFDHPAFRERANSVFVALRPAGQLGAAGVENPRWVSVTFDVIRPPKTRILIFQAVYISHTHLPMVFDHPAFRERANSVFMALRPAGFFGSPCWELPGC